MSREGVLAVYARYDAACNRHAFDELGAFVHPVLRVNAFPDYRWEIQRTVRTAGSLGSR